MLLAGFLGAVVVHLLPLDFLLEIEPGVGSLLLVALVGVFLPVPIAFDIVLAAVLVAAGAPMIYSMTLLFTWASSVCIHFSLSGTRFLAELRWS